MAQIGQEQSTAGNGTRSGSESPRDILDVAWDRLEQKMRGGQFDFPTYDFLHILNITNLERQLNSVNFQLGELGTTPKPKQELADFQNSRNTVLAEAKALLKEYCEYQNTSISMTSNLKLLTGQALHCYDYFLQLPEVQPSMNFDDPLSRTELSQSFRRFKSPLELGALQSLFRRQAPRPRPWDLAEGYQSPQPESHRNRRIFKINQILIGLLSGAVLVVPMVIMIYQPSQVKSVVTTSVTVVLLALALALVVKAEDVDVLAGTAALAAVLVVFIGASGSGGTQP